MTDIALFTQRTTDMSAAASAVDEREAVAGGDVAGDGSHHGTGPGTGSHHGTGPGDVAADRSHHGTGPGDVAADRSHHGTGPGDVAADRSHHGTGPGVAAGSAQGRATWRRRSPQWELPIR